MENLEIANICQSQFIVLYKCTDYYALEEDRFHWDDPSWSIEWPIAEPILLPSFFMSKGKGVYDKDSGASGMGHQAFPVQGR